MKRGMTTIAALLLAACGGESGESDTGNAAAGGEAATGGGATEEADGDGGGGGAGVATASFAPGLWETTTEVLSMNVPNMPQGFRPPMPPATTVRHCLTPEQVSRPPADFMSGGGESGGCTYQDFAMANGRIRGTIQCGAEAGSMRMTMDGSFTPTRYEMNQQVETSGQGMTMNMESRTTGRRVGDCP
jgi:hypothetical protein